jgi:hypothetical protein
MSSTPHVHLLRVGTRIPSFKRLQVFFGGGVIACVNSHACEIIPPVH